LAPIPPGERAEPGVDYWYRVAFECAFGEECAVQIGDTLMSEEHGPRQPAATGTVRLLQPISRDAAALSEFAGLGTVRPRGEPAVSEPVGVVGVIDSSGPDRNGGSRPIDRWLDEEYVR
jgi:hypothetical protein